jgi:hypothetical protein
MKLGAGKLPDDALLFGDINGNPPSPNAFSAAWSDFAASTSELDQLGHLGRDLVELSPAS